MFRKPVIFKEFPDVIAAQSTRHGGVSPSPWGSLNLGKSTDDSIDNVLENRRRFCNALGFDVKQLAWSKQVHGNLVRQVTAPGGAEGFDALMSHQRGILLAVSVADCTPILIYDARNNAIAAIHAGWRGTVAGIVSNTLQQMNTDFGTQGQDCRAYIGACISENVFEVGQEVADAFSDKYRRAGIVPGKYFIDLKKANADQCLEFGIPARQMEVSPDCTVLNNADYFSHRLERGTTGRMMAVIGLKRVES